MFFSAALLILLVGCTAVIGSASRYLVRPIPRFFLGLFAVMAILPFPRAFVSDVSILPLDHAVSTRPWMSPKQAPPYNPSLNDVVTQILPWDRAARLAWAEGSPPLRNRWNGCGMPLVANGVSAVFSPLTALALLLPVARAYTLLAGLKILLAAAGMWLWMCELGVSRPSACFASVAYAFSFSFTPPWLLFPQSSVLSLWPWMLFLIERCRGDERGRAIAALTAIFCFIELAGHPETAVMGFLFAGLWLAGRWLAGDLASPVPLFTRVGAAAALALGLTAFLLIPSLVAIAASGRIATMSRPYWDPILSLAPHGPQWRGLPTDFFPHTLGNGIGSPMLPGGGGSFPETTLGYFGIVGWAAALLIVRPGSRRPSAERALLGLLICGLGVSVGQWPFAEIFAHLPLIRFLFPLRFHSWVALSGSAIAAMELDRLARDWKTRRSAVAVLFGPFLLAVLAVFVSLWFHAEHAQKGGLPFQNRQLFVILSVLTLSALLGLVARGRPGLYAAGLSLLCGLELLYQWRGLFRVYSPALLFPETPLLRFLHAQAPPFRVVGEETTLFPGTNVFAGVEDIRTHDATERRDYLAFLNATCGYPSSDYFKTIRDLNSSALDFLNVRFLLTAPNRAAPGEKWRAVYAGADGMVFENARVLPRAIVPARVRLLRREEGGGETVTDASVLYGNAFREIASIHDWRERAFVLRERDAEVENAAAEVSDYSESTSRAFLRARVPRGTRDALVVLSLVQDGGWSARDSEGRLIRVLLANGPFLALEIPAGDHRITLTYRPPGFRLGVAVTLTTACGIAVGFLRRRCRRARERFEEARDGAVRPQAAPFAACSGNCLSSLAIWSSRSHVSRMYS